MDQSWIDIRNSAKAIKCDKIPFGRVDTGCSHVNYRGNHFHEHISIRERGSFGTVRIASHRYEIGGLIDLHGCSLDNSYKMLCSFVVDLYKKGKRCALVITGFREGEGLIRQNLPMWVKCKPFSDVVLHCVQASIAHGGAGAFYMVFKKAR